MAIGAHTIGLPGSRPIRAIVFDMDGTLLDSLPVVLDCYRRTVVEFGGPDLSPEEILAAFAIGPAATISPNDVAYVGDGPADVEVARSCGALAVAAAWGSLYHESHDADVTLRSPAELLSFVPDPFVAER